MLSLPLIHFDDLTTAGSRNTVGDIDAAIEGVVAEAAMNNPRYNSSEAALEKFREAAEKIKYALLNPAIPEAVVPQMPSSNLTERSHPHFARQFLNSTVSTNSSLEEARALVRLAQREADEKNAFRFKNPRLNEYYTNGTSDSAKRKRAFAADLLQINETVADAAALVAEADAAIAGELQSASSEYFKKNGDVLRKRAGAPFWMEGVSHTGNWPFGGASNNGYKVFRNVCILHSTL